MEKEWLELTPEEKREKRFKRWLSPDIKFSSPEAEKAYKARATRVMKALKLEIPDRVPVMIPGITFPAYNAGISLQTVMYDYDEQERAWLKFLHDFDQDLAEGAGATFSGRVYDFLDYKLYRWPGHGLPADARIHQFVEDEYMKADEYDAFIKDPLDFSLRYFLPRTWGVLAPLENMSRPSLMSLPFQFLTMCNVPEFQVMFKTIGEASREFAKWLEVVIECQQAALEAGFPPFQGGISLAPFDIFADMLRGTHGIFRDIFRQPDKLIKAMEVVTPLSVEEAVSSANDAGCPMIFIPIHKGDDRFMSRQQFQKFYWPSFRKLLLGLIDEGCIPAMVVDGSYNNRLDIIKDLPRASVLWIFEQADMFKAKEVLGDVACIAGNVTAAQLYTSTPQAIKEYCRQLIEVCGKGGGYILSLGSSVDKCNPENLQAMIEAAKEYGVYK